MLFILLAMIIAGPSGAQKTDVADMELKGKVKALKTKTTYRYKKNGVFTEWEKLHEHQYQFNNTGYKTEFKEYSGKDSLNYRITYMYVPKEKKAELSYFDKELKPTSKKTYNYNDKGYKIEDLEYSRTGELDRRYTYTYDDRGNMTEMTGYRKNGTVSSKINYVYDSKNKLVGLKVETPGYATSSREFVYDEKGNMTEEIMYDGDGEIEFRFVRTYNANGNKTQELKYKGEDQLLDSGKWRYDYDKMGNWTKRIQSTSDGNDFHIEERTIVYF